MDEEASMNIFFLHDEPHLAARYNSDVHVNKMLIECCQMMSTAARKHGFVGGYRDTHVNHPMTKWVGQSNKHFQWCFNHAVGLSQEYTHRYGKTHASSRLFPALCGAMLLIPKAGWRNPPRCIPDEFKVPYDEHQGDTSCHVASYRAYYANDKRHLHKWTKRSEPEWLADAMMVAA